MEDTREPVRRFAEHHSRELALRISAEQTRVAADIEMRRGEFDEEDQ
jgi:hypothetical protein